MPPKKKQKITEAPKKTPIIFQAPGLQPDIRLKVFDNEFIAHSQILKLYSAFFRKFLDSPDKQLNHDVQAHDRSRGMDGHVDNGKFKYEWVTEVDDDGTWSLVAASNASQNNPDFSAYKGDKKKDSFAFERLLCAMYMKPYEIEDCEDLQSIVDLSDYYCALPVISRSLGTVLLRSRRFVHSIPRHSVKIHQLAVKLRHEALYRDSLMFIIGCIEEPKYDLLKAPLAENAKNRYNELVAYVFQVEQRLLQELLYAEEPESDMLLELLKAAKYDPENLIDEPYEMSIYFRRILNNNCNFEGGFSGTSLDAVRKALENTTTLAQHVQVGHLSLEEPNDCEYFLCAEKVTGALPWDPEEVDW
ncbi:hypothetical protein HYFRA_00013084 [Hymenoscyphus fraxineus]|uniref:BTB domain-containing protein n=1 Tax=Hymenoscyphus fraxineus TaxID=746836 RepID=A0A9N9PM78_9HELO|nr:hypothetical protein HYFRA_00013084 [Hymenoscyphus fraxineus]